VRYGLNLQMQFRLAFVDETVPCLRQSVTGLSPRKAGFNPRSVNVRFLVGKKIGGTGTGFSPSNSGLLCQYHFTDVP
jgi:hypothetical protein